MDLRQRPAQALTLNVAFGRGHHPFFDHRREVPGERPGAGDRVRLDGRALAGAQGERALIGRGLSDHGVPAVGLVDGLR
jgi:hypothetical protein